jgi:hypothetical protein
MGRTLPSITQEFLMEQEAFMRFRRALRHSDQIALDDLFVSAQKHLAAAAYAAHALPLETFMLSMLLEEHKEVQRLRRQMDEITGQLPAGDERMLLDEEMEDTGVELAPVPQGDLSRAGIETPGDESSSDETALDRPGQRINPAVDPAEDAYGFDRLSHRVNPAAEPASVPRGGISRAGIEAPEVIDADPS